MGLQQASDEIPNRVLVTSPACGRPPLGTEFDSDQPLEDVMMKWLYFSTEWDIALDDETDEA